MHFGRSPVERAERVAARRRQHDGAVGGGARQVAPLRRLELGIADQAEDVLTLATRPSTSMQALVLGGCAGRSRASR